MEYLTRQPCTRKTAASRRIAQFAKRDVGRRQLLTHLIVPDAGLDAHPRRKLIGGAIQFFVALCDSGNASKTCMLCAAPFILGELPPRAFS